MKHFRPYITALPLILLSAALAWWLASKYLSYAVPMYESTAKLRLADINEGVPGNNLFKDLDVFASETKIAAEIEVMKSRVILEKVIDQLGMQYSLHRKDKLRKAELFNDSPVRIEVSGDASPLYRIPVEMIISDTSDITFIMPGGQVTKGHLDESVLLNGVKLMVGRRPGDNAGKYKINDHYIFELKSRESLVAELQSGLDITSVDKDVPVVRISYKSANPAKAAIIVNTVADNYIHDYIRIKYESADITSNFLKNQINDMSARLQNSENKIQDYRDKNNIINIRQETETDLRKISQLKIQQTNLKMNLEAIDQLNAYISKGKDNFLTLAPNFEAFTDLLSTEMIKKIKELQSEKKELLITYKEEDERVRSIDRKIGDYTSYLQESINNTRNNIQTKYNNLLADITEAEKVFIGLPEKEKLMTIMNREFELYQSSYLFLNNKKIEADVAKAAKYSFHRILSPATVSATPVSPNRTIIQIVSLLLGLFLGIAAIAAREMISPSIRTEDGLETRSNIPVAYLAEKFRTKASETEFFRRKLIELQVREIIRPGQMAAFSSLTGREFHHYHLANMAKAMAAAGSHTLIVDVDGSFAARYRTEDPRISVADLSEVYNGSRPESMEILKKQWLNEYDQVLVNNEKLHNGVLSSIFLKYSDVNFIVTDSRLTSAGNIATINEIAAEYNAVRPHFILNRANYSPGLIKRIAAALAKLRHTEKTVQAL